MKKMLRIYFLKISISKNSKLCQIEKYNDVKMRFSQNKIPATFFLKVEKENSQLQQLFIPTIFFAFKVVSENYFSCLRAQILLSAATCTDIQLMLTILRIAGIACKKKNCQRAPPPLWNTALMHFTIQINFCSLSSRQFKIQTSSWACMELVSRICYSNPTGALFLKCKFNS